MNKETPQPRDNFTHTLPTLNIPDVGEPIIRFNVLPYPSTDQSRLLTWTVDERPSRKVRFGQLVSMWTPRSRSGTGMLTAITDLRRYWVTWTVSCDTAKCKIRIPISWTVLPKLEATAHEKHYLALPNTPQPHHSDPILETSFTTTYPYQHEVTPEEKKTLEGKLETITRRKWQWGGASNE